MLTLLLIGILTLAFNIQQVKTEPATIIVPDDYSTIREAVNRAKPGDLVYVRAGTYFEKEVTINKPLTLIGENRSTTVIDGDGTWVCVYIQSTYNVNVSGFTIQNGYGIYLYRSKNVVISGNTISNNGQGIILLESTSNTISKNIVILNGAVSILISGSSDNKIYENIVTLNSGDGIWLENSQGNNITRNNISDNYSHGMHLRYSGNSTVAENIIKNNGRYGTWLFSSGNSTIKGNIVSNNYDSNIVIERSDGSLLEGNTASKVEFSVVLQDTKDNILRDNKISDSYVGLWVSTAFNCTMAGNSIQDNAIGVRIYGSDNIFYHNTFINNTMFQVQVPGHEENIWDDGYPSGGNFWSDYEDIYPDAEELDNSGIWDTPYFIDENNQDNYPLMEPWTPPPPAPTTIHELKTKIEELGSEGEIDNKGIVKSLIAKMKVSQKLVDKEKTDDAKIVLEDFIIQVQNLSGIHITPEAADILIRSAEYILSHL